MLSFTKIALLRASPHSNWTVTSTDGVCIHVHMYGNVCMGVYTYVHVMFTCAWKCNSHACMCMCDPRSISCVFLSHYPTFLWRKVLSLNPELSFLSSLASPWLCLPQYGIPYSLPFPSGCNMFSCLQREHFIQRAGSSAQPSICSQVPWGLHSGSHLVNEAISHPTLPTL